MREILFKGKRVDNGEWIYGYYMYQNEEDKRIIVDTTRGVIGCGIQVVAETIGEYTGLTDKNGKKIFEGDIVKRNDSMGYKTIGEVAYYMGGFCLKFKSYNGANYYVYPHFKYKDFVDMGMDGRGDVTYEYEVIGNKWDNSKLLGENNG